jgi:hypothetical protein
MKYFVYNFNGTIYETTTAFDDTYRQLKAECVANGEPFSRQVKPVAFADCHIVSSKYLRKAGQILPRSGTLYTY